ncbi:MAG TPA: nucleotide exchange factor GrpE [Candidatus Alistipes intestinipullorum]|nr:nucleotide exchange factor GrpE [Candidatus Alistipes intestinipullorum]
MKKKNVYNEEVVEKTEGAPGEGETSCGEVSGDNLSAGQEAAADTMSDTAAEPATDTAQAVEAAVAEWKDKYLRLQAEFDNYRKRTLKEKMDLVQTGGRDVLLSMLPVRDDVQRALAAMKASNDIEALRQGVELISQKFTEALRQKGVTEMELKEKEFDADVAEAVAKFAAGEEMKGRVIDVIQTGYMLGDKVLRFAKVVVGE